MLWLKSSLSFLLIASALFLPNALADPHVPALAAAEPTAAAWSPYKFNASVPIGLSFSFDKKIVSSQLFPKDYAEAQGVFTFRGGNERSSPSFGAANLTRYSLSKAWSFATGSSSWGGGAGWTGQPAIVKWPKETRLAMNIKPKFKTDNAFAEVIYASLDGNVYFFDLASGERSREPIHIGNPIKGSVSVDPRGYPLLYVGEGIPEKGTIGFNLFSLIDGKRIFRLNGIDPYAYRGWGAFDGSALFNRETDTMIVGGENGLVYFVKLNSSFLNGKFAARPSVVKYRYALYGKSDSRHMGIENSLAAYKNLLFFADNGGAVHAFDMYKNKPLWSLPHIDDTDASIVVFEEDGVPFIYTGTEVDIQGAKGDAVLRKINGLTGKTVWEKRYPCYTQLGAHPVNGGLLATPSLDEKNGQIIFTLARYKTFSGGAMIALDLKTGAEKWRRDMKNYAWSSPTLVRALNGGGYLLQADSVGVMKLIRASDGKLAASLGLGANIEASPAVFDNRAVVATRGGQIIAFDLK